MEYITVEDRADGSRLLIERRGEPISDLYTPVLVTPEELSRVTRKYVRCRLCAPAVPDYAAPDRTRSKQAANLQRTDLGRRTAAGVLERFTHDAEGVTVTIDGVSQTLTPSTPIVFMPKPSPRP